MHSPSRVDSGRRRRAARAALAVAAAAAVSLGAAAGSDAVPSSDDATLASGTGPAGESPGHAHARIDLAGVPMTTVERWARARVGLRPRTGYAAATATAALALGPQTSGQWAPMQAAPVVPVLTAVLPNGKVLMWDSIGDLPTNRYPDQTSTRVAVWDPATAQFTRIDVSGSNIFCAGFVQLADGRVFVAGGTKNAAFDGIQLTHIFDWKTMSWQQGPDMAYERWYPSVSALMDGQALILAGGPDVAEIRGADGSIRALPGITSPSSREYPFTQSSADGRVLHSGAENQIRRLDWNLDGAMEPSVGRDGITRTYGSYASYAPGLTLVTGGGAALVDGVEKPYASTTIVDTRAGVITTHPATSMANRRRQHQLTILADGSVLATGGMSETGNGLISLDHAVYAAERWVPEANTWTQLASAAVIREYHSTAVLLPDGRVLTGGGGLCESCASAGYLRKDIEVFSPPYLFAPDGSPAPRPAVTSPPASITVDRAFTVGTPDAAQIARVGLVRLGAATHSVDQGQRYIPLAFSQSATNTLTVAGPLNSAEAPPGYYMLFLVNGQGVPSVAPIVQVVLPDRGVSSVGVSRSVGPAAVLYSGLRLTGAAQPIEGGTWRATRGALASVGDRQLSSVDIADGWTVRLCRDDAGTDCAVLGPGAQLPLPQGFDNRVRAAVVRPLAADGVAPTTPTGLTVVRGFAGGAVLRWGASSDDKAAPLYAVYRSMQRGFVPSGATLIGTSITTTFHETSSARPGVYYYRVVALDPAGNRSAPTPVVVSVRR